MAIGTAIMNNLLPGYSDALRRERVGELATGVQSGQVPLDQAYMRLAEITGRPETLSAAINKRYAGDIISGQQDGGSPYDSLLKYAEMTGDMGLFERASKDRMKQDALSNFATSLSNSGETLLGLPSGALSGLISSGQLTPQSALSNAVAMKRLGATAGGGTQGALARLLMKENPNMNYTQAMGLMNYGLKKGLTPTAQGTMAPAAGVTESLSAIEQAKQEGQVKGSGKVTDIQKKASGQGQVSSLIKDITTKYQDLDKMGAIVDPKESAASNISAATRSSGVGQAVGKIVGTPEQSIRNKIQQARPLLVQAIRQATAMGAKGMDSEKELEFYLNAATDPKLDIEANLDALKRLEDAYGLSAKTPDGIKLEAPSTSQDVKTINFEDLQ